MSIDVATIGGWGRSAVDDRVRAAHLPIYNNAAVITGSAILLALCVIVLVASVVGWWRRR
jgi:hypothetical protein